MNPVNAKTRPTRNASGVNERYTVRFSGKLVRYPGTGGWVFVTVPGRLAPPVTHAWGRTPVRATVDAYEWDTSVWRGKEGRTVMAVPKRARGAKGDGDTVRVSLTFRSL
jgi:hypothetical protein